MPQISQKITLFLSDYNQLDTNRFHCKDLPPRKLFRFNCVKFADQQFTIGQRFAAFIN